MVLSTFLNALAQYVDDTRTGVIARGKRITSSTGTTTEVGVLRIDGIPLTAGKTYRIATGTLLLDTTVNNDAVDVRIRYDTSGSAATTSSTTIPGGLSRKRLADNAVAESTSILCTYTPASDETLSVLLTVGRFSGSGTVIIFADSTATTELFVEDYGTDTGDQGVDI
jgi:hypothetical protein